MRDQGSADPTRSAAGRHLRATALMLGPLAGLAPLVTPSPPGLEPEAWRLVGLMAWMVVWWLSEAVPIPVTALLPLPLMPLLGILRQGDVAANYGHPLVFLFLGGFLIAGALRRWGLHRRFALMVVRLVGPRPRRLVGGVMLATAFLSMWISNTAATIMMYAVGLSLVHSLAPSMPTADAGRRFGVALMLAIAYGASIGGLGTLVGTPPNVLLAGFLAERYGIVVDFQRWLAFGLPIVLVLLPLTWLWLTRYAFPLPHEAPDGAGATLGAELEAEGPLGTPERAVLGVFAAAALGWIFRPQLVRITGLDISDTTVAIAAALLLFALPASLAGGRFLLDGRALQDVAWDVLLLFGGGLALAMAFESTGLAQAVADGVATLHGVDTWLLVLILAATVMILGELASNTASAATFLPVAGAVAIGLGLDPLLLALPVALAASANFAMPVATPPNAIVFAYEGLTIRDMIRAGLVVDGLALVLILLWTMILHGTGALS